ncbi:LYR motif-containing protein 2 [Lingula anatina]|uniref:LYR motif-containing protein 2 n=1 Tax=Lingula anatina TaxID=7574 RepID=A0A1S3HHE6_LINAN|nr:LYR motif-containing protein 2 [Lingula anatina]|eukprot:XP_013384926.1 LYR motif-containing protein 2 [Lingula anatina]
MVASKLPEKTLSFSRFLLRAEVLKLYRQFGRTLQCVPDKSHRAELQTWVRTGFKQNIGLEDELAIKMCISQAQKQLKELERMLKLSQVSK